MPSAAELAGQMLQQTVLRPSVQLDETLLADVQHKLAQAERDVLLFASTLWRLVAEPVGVRFTPQQVKEGLCSGALKAQADMVSINGVQRLLASAIARLWTDAKRRLKEAKRTFECSHRPLPQPQPGLQALEQVLHRGQLPPSSSSSHSTSPPSGSYQHAALLHAPSPQRPSLSPHSLAVLGIGSNASPGDMQDPQARAAMLLESLNLTGPHTTLHHPPGPSQPLTAHPQELHRSPETPSMQAVMAAQLSADVLARAHTQVVQFLESVGVAPGPPPGQAGLLASQLAVSHATAASAPPSHPSTQPTAAILPHSMQLSHLSRGDAGNSRQLPLQAAQLPASSQPQRAGSDMPAAAPPSPRAGEFAQALQPWMSPADSSLKQQAEPGSGQEPQHQHQHQHQQQHHLHQQQQQQQRSAVSPEPRQAPLDPAGRPGSPQPQTLPGQGLPFTTPSASGRASPQLHLGEDAQHNARQLLQMLDLGWGCTSPATEGHPGTLPFTPALLPLDGGASWICAPSRDEDHQATLSSRSPLKPGPHAKAPAAAQPTAAHLPGGTPASDGSTRTGVNLSRSTSPAADMPHGPHSLPIPDFVCQSFEQQALCPVDRQADVEAAQPVPDVPLPAPRRKPGRKPKKDKAQKQQAAGIAATRKASQPSAVPAAEAVAPQPPVPGMPLETSHADGPGPRSPAKQRVGRSRQRQAAAQPAQAKPGLDPEAAVQHMGAQQQQDPEASKHAADSTSSRSGTPAPVEQPACQQQSGTQQQDDPTSPAAEARPPGSPFVPCAAGPAEPAVFIPEEPVISGISERVKGSKRRRSATPAAPQPPAKQPRPAYAGRSAKQQQQQQSASQPAARRPMLPAPRPKNSSSRTVMAMKRLMAPPQPSASWQAPALSQARPSSRSCSPAAPRQSPTPTTASKPAEQRSGPQKATKQKRPATADSGRRGKRGLVVEKAADPGCARARPYQRQRRAGDAQRPSLPQRTAAAKAAPIASTDCLAGNRRRDGRPGARAGAWPQTEEKWAELKRTAPSLRLGRSVVEGFGLFARDEIKAETFLCEYVGELIRRPLEDAREEQWQAQGKANYLFRLDKEWVIDATARGNHARYINHSCDGNCQSFTVVSKSRTRIIICAKRDIQPGEELCYDYKFAREPEEAAVPCFCGSGNCTGRMN